MAEQAWRGKWKGEGEKRSKGEIKGRGKNEEGKKVPQRRDLLCLKVESHVP